MQGEVGREPREVDRRARAIAVGVKRQKAAVGVVENVLSSRQRMRLDVEMG
jgi:hypothetical protein